MDFGSFAYKVMAFGINNAHVVFLRILVKSFQEFIYKTMTICFDSRPSIAYSRIIFKG
jgi:hypothetical protein